MIGNTWRRFWVRAASFPVVGRIAARIAVWGTVPYHGRDHLPRLSRRGFVEAGAVIAHPNLRRGSHVYLGDGVIVYHREEGGAVELHDEVYLYGDSFLQTGRGGSINIGEGTHIQPGCYLLAIVSDIVIGRRVEIAANCAFYPYDHGMAPGKPVMGQPLESKGPITIGDGAWLGHGVTVLSGVRIGAGAVIGAGSVVVSNVPDNAIAAGIPAKVIRYREEAAVREAEKSCP